MEAESRLSELEGCLKAVNMRKVRGSGLIPSEKIEIGSFFDL